MAYARIGPSCGGRGGVGAVEVGADAGAGVDPASVHDAERDMGMDDDEACTRCCTDMAWWPTTRRPWWVWDEGRVCVGELCHYGPVLLFALVVLSLANLVDARLKHADAGARVP